MDRRATLLWMKDILDHLAQCYDEWSDADAIQADYLAGSMQRGLDECRRLCDALKADAYAAAGRPEVLIA